MKLRTRREGQPTVITRAESRVEHSVSASLLTALAASIARRAGIRALVLKGLAAEAYGLRPTRGFADVDVLTAPRDASQYVAEFRRAGWRERPRSSFARTLSPHAVSLFHPRWSMDIDVHSFFPGFLADPDEVFALLWGRRTILHCAGTDVCVPDWASAVLVSALHALRSKSQARHHDTDLAWLRTNVLSGASPEAIREIVELARTTGALEAVTSALGEYVGTVARSDHPESPAARAWRLRVETRGERAVQALQHVKNLPLREAGRFAVRAVWPSAGELRDDYPDVAAGAVSAGRKRFDRLAHGLDVLRREAPQMIARGWHEKLGRQGRGLSGPGPGEPGG